MQVETSQGWRMQFKSGGADHGEPDEMDPIMCEAHNRTCEAWSVALVAGITSKSDTNLQTSDISTFWESDEPLK